MPGAYPVLLHWPESHPAGAADGGALTTVPALPRPMPTRQGPATTPARLPPDHVPATPARTARRGGLDPAVGSTDQPRIDHGGSVHAGWDSLCTSAQDSVKSPGHTWAILGV